MSNRSADAQNDYLIDKRAAHRFAAPPPASTTLPLTWAASLAQTISQIEAEHGDLEATADRVAAGAVRLLTAVDLAGMYQVGHDHHVTTAGASSPVVQVLGQVQQHQRTGPCLTAWTGQVSVTAVDLASERRWPRFVAAARDAGICGILAIPLSVRTRPLGVLTLYSLTAGVFDEVAVQAAHLFAAHAAVTLDAAWERMHLQVAIDRRDQIGQAKGILMERLKVTAADAFALLVQASQHTNISLRLVVEEFLQTGQLPGRTVPRHRG